MKMFYVPCHDKKEAELISKKLLEKRLIACANIIPITSMYWWDDNIVTDHEVVLIIKSIIKYKEQIIENISKLHAYDISCIMCINVEANKPFEQFILQHVIQ